MEKELEEDIDHCVDDGDDNVLPLETLTTLKRLKTWKRACMSGERLCGLAMLHVHRDKHIIRPNYDPETI